MCLILFPSLCKPRMVYKIDRAHGLQISPYPCHWPGGLIFQVSLIEYTQKMKAIAYFPQELVNLVHADRFLGQNV